MAKRAKKFRITPKIQSLVLLTTGVLFLTLFLTFKIHQARSLSFNMLPATTRTTSMKQTPQSIEIIPLSVKLSVAPAKVEGNNWQINENGASYLTSSARAKEQGNMVIYAHNKANLFGPLSQVKVGYPITIKTKEGKIFSYSVYKIDTVSPDHVEVLKSTGKEELTLYTCTGFADTKRLVVKARPI